MNTSTIAAISTPQGSGGIGIIRISGANSVNIAEQMFRSYSGKKVEDLAGYSGMLGEIVKNGQTIDQAIVYRFVKPKSYTGEDVVEISSHGGSWVMSQILRYTFELGAQPAEAGEFTKRAFLNGKMDLFQAEAVMDIINAQGDASLKAANNLREGILSTEIRGIVDKILDQSAHLAAWSDYPDEEMDMVDEDELLAKVNEAKQELLQLIETYDYGSILKEGIQTAIVGKPNVGKSTLMNILSGYETSIVSNIPGTTRDVVKESIRLGNLTLQLADTAGIRSTEDVIEQVGVERAKKQIEGAQLVLAIFDYSQKLDDADLQLIQLLKGKQVIALVNKDDLNCEIDLDLINDSFEYVLTISARESSGIEKLEKNIEELLDLQRFNQGDIAIISNERQRQSLFNAVDSIDEAVNALKMGITLDAVSVCLDGALDALLSLSGERVQDEVVNQVFAKFCVGK